MSKYTLAAQRNARRVEKKLPPIWRGIGCLMILVIPLISYFLGVFTVQLAVDQNWPMPYQIMGYPMLPGVFSALPGLIPIVNFIEAQQNLYAILAFAIVYIIVFGGLLSVLYSLLYGIVGPPRYGPLDAPPPKTGVKRYKR